MKKIDLTNRLTVCAIALFACFLWGSAVPVIKTGYRLIGIETADSAGQVMFGGVRFALAGLMVVLLGSMLSGQLLKPNMKMIKPIVILSIFQTIGQYVFFYIGAAHVSGVKGVIIAGMSHFCAILVACLLFRQEKFTARLQIGCALGVLGVVLVNVIGSSMDAGFSLLGEGFYLISCFCSGTSTVLINRFSKDNNPVTLSGYQFMLGGIVMCVIAKIMDMSNTDPAWRTDIFSRMNIPAVCVLLYLAFVSAAAYTLWSILLRHNPVSRVAIFGFTTPIFGSIISAVVLDEYSQLGIGTVLSLALVSTGIAIINMKKE